MTSIMPGEPITNLLKSPMTLTDDNELVNFESGFSGRVEITYLNGLDREVFVADRHGAVVKLPAAQQWTNHIHVRVVRWFAHGSRVTLNRPARENKLESSRSELAMEQAVRENFLSKAEETWGNRLGRTKDLHLKITLERIESLGGAFYHPDTDLVFSLTAEGAVHPESSLVISKRTQSRPPVPKESAGEVTAGVSVSIIDNSHKSSDRFVYLLGKIHRVKSKSCSRLEDGIYVNRHMAITAEGGFKPDDLEVFPLTEESFTTLGLFKSYEDALHWVKDLKDRREIQLTDKKAKLAEKKVELETSSLERKDKYEETGMARKDRYDAASTSRKDSSDELKWILGVVGTILGIAALLGKR